ncbi:MAG: glycogen synthase, partial [Desulfuromonas sp.]
MKILMVSSEAVPFAKTGGLADVAGALPRALHRLGHDVRLALPAYRCVSEAGLPLLKGRRSVSVPLDGRLHKGLLRQGSLDDMPVYLLENKEFFHRDGLYGDAEGDYSDNPLRFAFFCRAVLALLRRLDFRPDIIHINDWQTALIPVYLRTELRFDP